MNQKLPIRLATIESVTSTSELLQLGEPILRDLGIVAYFYTHLPPLGVDAPQIIVPIESKKFSPEFVRQYDENEWFRIDPFVRYAMRTSEIFKWSFVEHLEQGNPKLKVFFETMAKTVKGDGLSMATYGPNNTNGYFALATGLEVIDFTKETLSHIQTTCQAIHVQYCLLSAQQRKVSGLSQREIQVMKYVVRGQKSAEIAEKMDVSTHTVNTYLKRVFEKLDVNDRVSASMKFLALGYLYE